MEQTIGVNREQAEPVEAGTGLWSLEPYLEQLKDLALPKGTFDAEGPWEHAYDVYPVYGKWSESSEKHRGFCKIQRSGKTDGGSFQLDVRSEVTYLNYGSGIHPTRSQVTTASIRCANNILASPVSWELESVALDESKKPRPLSEMSESAVMVDGNINLMSKKGNLREIKVNGGFTCNWSLFDAIQRMYRKETPQAAFTVLEDLRLVRANQRLRFDGLTQVQLGGSTVGLYGFHQIGEGILPIHYWLDEEGRLLFVIGGVRVYFWHNE
jgi:hypothetical protein